MKQLSRLSRIRQIKVHGNMTRAFFRSLKEAFAEEASMEQDFKEEHHACLGNASLSAMPLLESYISDDVAAGNDDII